MKLALFGANGMAGSRIATEALSRGHYVTAIVRDLDRFSQTHEHLTVVVGEVLDSGNVAEIVKGHDAVISAAGPGATKANDPTLAQDLVKAAYSLIEGLTTAGVHRLLIVGGAGSLEVAPGVQLVDAPDFPAQYLSAALAHRESLSVYSNSNLDWTYISPALEFSPGERTTKFRLGSNQLLVDEQGKSKISAEDYAIAVVDELENNQFLRRQITVAY